MVFDVNAALGFIDNIKNAYGAGSEYQAFLDMLKDFKCRRTNERETNRRVIALFQEHPELIEGYAAFMPPGHTIARDGTVVNETYIQPPEPQGEETKLPEKEKRLLQTLRDQIVDTQEQEEYNTLITLFGTNLTISPEQRKASLGAGQRRELVEKLQGLLGNNDELKKALSDILS